MFAVGAFEGLSKKWSCASRAVSFQARLKDVAAFRCQQHAARFRRQDACDRVAGEFADDVEAAVNQPCRAGIGANP